MIAAGASLGQLFFFFFACTSKMHLHGQERALVVRDGIICGCEVLISSPNIFRGTDNGSVKLPCAAYAFRPILLIESKIDKTLIVPF